MDLLASCCGMKKRVDIFEQARLACTTPNWETPPAQPLCRILEILAGGNPDFQPQTGFNNILAHLQQDQLRKNVTYVLKNLILLDLIVEQRLFLNRMSRYYNSQLIYMQGENNSNKNIITIRDLIASYYVYVKQKAKYYEIQSPELLSQSERQKFMEKSNSIAILNEINVCFKIQNLILDVNSKFKNGDKSPDLICFIYSLLLKTYLFCHSIVSIALKTFVRRIPQLNHYDLQYIKKFANYFNKDYSKNFAYFVSSNQSIPTFSQIQYQQLIFTSEKMIELIETQLKFIQDDPGICPQVIELSPEQLKALSSIGVKEQKEQKQISTTETISIEKQISKRKQFAVAPQQDHSQTFKNYLNTYSEDWQQCLQNEGENIPQFMDPYQISSYYGVYRPQNEQNQKQQEAPQKQEQNLETAIIDQQESQEASNFVQE